MHGFLLKGGAVSVYDFPYATAVTNTTFLGINIYDQIVGNYMWGQVDASQCTVFCCPVLASCTVADDRRSEWELVRPPSTPQ